MRKIFIILTISSIILLTGGCGNLLEEPGREPTLEQKLRGVWIVGGLSQNGTGYAVPGIDLYDPEQDQWFPNVTSLQTAVSFAGVESNAGKIYIFGGFDSTTCINTVQIYDIRSNSWTVSPNNMPQARANISAVCINNYIYIFGGTTGVPALWGVAAANSVPKFNTLDNTWGADIPTIATNRANIEAVAINDLIYFHGGRTGITTFSTAHDGYIPSIPNVTSATEVTLGPAPATLQARAGHATVLYEPTSGPSRMIIFGGVSAVNSSVGSYFFYNATTTTIQNTGFYINNPFAGPATWQSITSNYPDNISFAGVAVYGTKLYIFGGATSLSNVSKNVNRLELSNLPAGTWEAKTDMPVARFGHKALTIKQ